VFRQSKARYVLRYTTFVGDDDVNNEQAPFDAKSYDDDVSIRRL
ncbi:unnamed protein product, partial [Rotaria sp. Silwood1]